MTVNIEPFDVIVIGDGDAGNTAALRAARMGKRTAMIFRGPYAGTCLNVGCVPSKFLIHRAQVSHSIRTASRFQVGCAPPSINLAAIINEKEQLITQNRAEQYQRDNQIENLFIIEGEGRFAAPGEIHVSGRRLQANTIIVATGTRPAWPAIPGLEQVDALTSDRLMALTTLPDHLLIVGGGYIGCELGQTFRRFGSAVTIAHTGAHLLSSEDEELAILLEKAFEAEEIQLVLESKVTAVQPTECGLRLVIETRDGQSLQRDGSHLLVATGRIPNTEDLNLEAAGVECDKQGYIIVDEYLETNVAGVYAAGDINGQQPYTRVAHIEAEIAISNAFSHKKQKINRTLLAHAVFTNPPLASVGLTEKEAHEQGEALLVSHFDISQLERAQLQGLDFGMIKFVAQRHTHRILGAQIIGESAPELIYSVVVAMQAGGTLESFANAPDIFPTLHEALHLAAQQLLEQG